MYINKKNIRKIYLEYYESRFDSWLVLTKSHHQSLLLLPADISIHIYVLHFILFKSNVFVLLAFL